MNAPPSPVRIHAIWLEAKRAALRGNGYKSEVATDEDLATQQSALRRVSVEFHKRLAAAGIHVETAENTRRAA